MDAPTNERPTRPPVEAAAADAPSVSPWGLIVVLGLSLGILALALEHVPEPVSRLSAQGGPWLVVGFVAGTLARHPLLGGIAGLTALVAATAAYYLGKALVGSPLNPAEYDDRAFWFAAAVVAGGVFGIAGGLRASRGPWARVITVAALSGTIMVDALWQTRGGWVWVAMGAVAVLLPLLLLGGARERALGLALTFPIAGVLRLAADLVLPTILRFR